MNLDSLSFTLSQISYLVANLSKKNYEDSCQRISGVSILRRGEKKSSALTSLYKSPPVLPLFRAAPSESSPLLSRPSRRQSDVSLPPVHGAISRVSIHMRYTSTCAALARALSRHFHVRYFEYAWSVNTHPPIS